MASLRSLLSSSLLPKSSSPLSRRSFNLSASLLSTPPSSTKPAAAPMFRPGPPSLPAAEQREFEALQKKAQTVDLADVVEPDLHRDLRRTPKPDFEGEVNPVTGEVGGPKKDPLLGNEWTFGGRATDF